MRLNYNFKLTDMILFKKLMSLAIIMIASINTQAQQNKVVIEGVLEDNTQMTIPYVAVSIPTKNIGTTSTEEGRFYLSLKQNNLQDTLVISSMGFKTFKIKVEDYLHQKNKTIVLEDDVSELENVVIKSAKEYIYEVLKQRKKTFVSDSHQLDFIYRRSDVEQDVSKFFVEHYMSIVYKGPKSYVSRMQVNEARKSADYRIAGKPQGGHSGLYMFNINPLNDYFTPIKKMEWKKIGDTTYDGESVLILEGTKENLKRVGKPLITVLYIGMDTNNIYRIECSSGNQVYQYVKNSEGKMYLSYHKREYYSRREISARHQKALKLKTPQISIGIRHEALVLGIKTDKKQFTAKGYDQHDKEMGNVKLRYNPTFWDNLSLPPDTAFYKKIKAELESNYGVPLETQFNLVN